MAIPEILGIISLEDAKRYAGVTSTTDDRLIDELVQQASQMINGELGYNVISQTYKEYHSGSGGPNIWLANIPVTSVDLATTGRDIPMSVNYGGGDASRATAEITSTLLRLRKRVSGVTTTSELTLASSATFTALETAVELLTGWTATTTTSFANYTPSELVIRPAMSANDRDLDLQIPQECETDYEIHGEAGRLYNPYLWDAGNKNVYVEYTAGYLRSEVPYDLKSACLELCKFLYDVVQHDASIKEEEIGDYSYKLADMAGSVFKEDSNYSIADKLAPYKRMFVRGM